MGGDASAYAALGLDPDADDAEIEQAYRRLIKQHHPDCEGGDARRAAEINHAYRELRGSRCLREAIELYDDHAPRRREGSAWIFLALLLAVAVAAFFYAQGAFAPPGDAAQSSARPRLAVGRKAASAPADPMDQPLHLAAIDAAARNALNLVRTRDEIALASASRDCHHMLRRDPSLLQLDRCAAFDDAVVELEDRDPLRDQGPFGEIAVTGRIWSGASALSDDSLAIDGRLGRIRLRVELALAALSDPGQARSRDLQRGD